MAREVRDYSDDDTTQTLSIITDVTECNCLVTEREFSYLEPSEFAPDDCEIPNTKYGVEITLETLTVEDDPVYRSLEELRQESEQDVEFDI